MNKPSFQERLSDEAKALPARSHGWFRTWFKKVWDVRGGGLYATGFALTFLWLEVTSIAEDLADVGMLFDGQAIQFVIGLIVDSFKNTLQAFMWPVDIVMYRQPFGAILLGIAFWLFPIYAKPRIEAWLFDDEDEDEADSD